MADALNITLCAPERPEIQLSANEIMVPGGGGVYTIQADHTPILTTLVPGVLEITAENGEKQYFAVNGGFCNVKDNQIRMLAELLEPGVEIELKRAEEARERAERRLIKVTEDLDVKRAETALKKAIARIDAHHGRGH